MMVRTGERVIAKTAALLGTALMSVGAFVSPALAAEPVMVESENIVFYGEVDPALARDRVRKWEIYRRMVYALSGVTNPPADPEKLTIYGFPGTDDLQVFTDNRGIAGVYTQGIEGPIFLTSVNDKYTEGGFSEHVGLHEYTHHVLRAFVKQSFPRWYDEGFANYLMSMYIGEKSVVIGSPKINFAQAVKNRRVKWLDPETVLSANSMYPLYTRPEMRKGGPTSFYAQGWLYVHYLRSNPELNSKLPRYLQLLNTTGYNAVEAFEEAYGMSIDKFHKDAARYFRKNDFVQTEYLPGPEIMDVDVKIRKIDEVELRRKQIPARLAFLGDGNAKSFRRDVMSIYEKTPSDPKVQMALVSLDVHDENYDDAVLRAMSALAAAPQDRIALHTAAYAKYMSVAGPHQDDLKRGEYAPLPVDERLDESMDLYVKLLEADPMDFYAVNFMTQYYGSSEAEVTDYGFDAARIYDIRYMEGFSPSMGMNLATIYAKKGFEFDACSYYYQAKDATDSLRGKSEDYFDMRLAWFEKNYGQNCAQYAPEKDAEG